MVVKGRVAIGLHPGADRRRITPVIHTVVDLAVCVLDTGCPALGHSLLETEDVFVLRHRAQVDIGNRCWQGQAAITDDAGLADLHQIERLGGDRISATVGVVGLCIGLAARCADVGVGGDRDEVATGIAVDLERRVVVHVPGEADPRCQQVVFLDKTIFVAVHVVERFPTQTTVQQQVLLYLPAVLDIESLVDHIVNATGRAAFTQTRVQGTSRNGDACHGPGRHVVAEVLTAAEGRSTRLGGTEFLVVDTGTDGVIAQGVINVKAVRGARVAVGRWCIRIATRQTREGLIPATGVGRARKHIDGRAVCARSARTGG